MRFTLGIALVLVGPLSAQTTWHVAVGPVGTGDGAPGSPFASIQAAIDAAAPAGDEVRIESGTYPERIDLVGKAVLVYSAAGPNTVFVTGDATGPIVRMTSDEGPATILRGLTLTGGVGETLPSGETAGGGAFLLDASPRFEACAILGNSAEQGAGVYASGGAVEFQACRLAENTGVQGVGLFYAGGQPQLVNCVVEDNSRVSTVTTNSFGIGVALVDTLPGTVMQSCVVRGNTSPDSEVEGVGIWVSRSVQIFDSRISDNQSGDGLPGIPSGGTGIGLYSSGTVTLERCTFRNNLRAFEGGAIASVLGTLLARHCLFEGNGAGLGGAVNGGTYEDCVFRGNSGQFDGVFVGKGAGAYNASLVRCRLFDNHCLGTFAGGGGAASSDLVDCAVFGNSARHGGGLFDCNATGCLIEDNEAVNMGGGADASTLTDCVVRFNRAVEGGGLFLSTATGGRIVGNLATLQGGGAIYGDFDRTVIFDNRAPRGAGLFAPGTVSSCTLAGNVAEVGSGAVTSITFGSFRPVLENCIVWGNEPEQFDVSTGNVDATWSLVEGGWTGIGNIDATPQFFGPASGDLYLMSGSPAIDAANPVGRTDPDGSRADMGALPFDPGHVFEPGLYCQPKPNSLGCVASLSTSGSPTISGPDDFELLAGNLTGGSIALAVLGPSTAAQPFAGGVLCVGAGAVRLGFQATGGAGGCDGTAAFSLSALRLNALGVGSLGYAQILYRDASHPDGTGVALSNGLEFRVLP